MSGWWYRATQEQKLAQIDAAIEVGMTVPQVAINCGANVNTVGSFATNHGRHFSGFSKNQQRKTKRDSAIVRWENGKPVSGLRASIADAKEAFLSGAPVDFWGAE